MILYYSFTYNFHTLHLPLQLWVDVAYSTLEVVVLSPCILYTYNRIETLTTGLLLWICNSFKCVYPHNTGQILH